MGLGQSAVFEVRQALEWRCGRRWLNGPLVGRQNIVSCILAKWKSVQLDWKPGSCSPYHRFAYKRHSSTWKLSIIARHLIRLLLLLLVQGASILFLSDARLLRRLRSSVKMATSVKWPRDRRPGRHQLLRRWLSTAHRQ